VSDPTTSGSASATGTSNGNGTDRVDAPEHAGDRA